MVDPIAGKLWDLIGSRGGSIALEDASFHEIECGIIRGWLNTVSNGRFEASKELRALAGEGS